MAEEVLMSISKDERERAIYRNRRIALADRESDRVTADRVIRYELARKLLKRNRPIDEIMEDTGLTCAEVEGLRGDAD